MNKRKIIIASPREPCGATWLINCFLELGILTYRGSIENMWYVEGDKYFLSKNENILKKWLPSLSRNEHFNFKDDIEVEWVHEWPTNKFDNYKIIFFVRDPRDALYSRYKRESPRMSYSSFIGFLNPDSLLDKVETFYFFLKCWMAHPNSKFFRFEDYKKDPKVLLAEILSFIDIDIQASNIEAAVEHSTSEQAALSEQQYRQENIEDRQVINRGGIVGKWKNLTGKELDVSHRIHRTCGGLLTDLGYTQGGKDLISMSTYLAHTRNLSFFRNFSFLPKSEGSVDKDQHSKLRSRVLNFAIKLDQHQIKCAKLNINEILNLILTLSEFLICQREGGIKHMENLYSTFVNKNSFYIELFKRTGSLSCLHHIDRLVLLNRMLKSIKRRGLGYLWN